MTTTAVATPDRDPRAVLGALATARRLLAACEAAAVADARAGGWSRREIAAALDGGPRRRRT